MLPLLPADSRFPLPDWNAVHASVPEDIDLTELNDFWTGYGREWIHQLRAALGEGYIGYETPHFLLVSREPAEVCRRILRWAETTAHQIKEMLKVDFAGQLFGKCPIIVVHDLDTYYEYFAAHVPDGTYAGSGGVYLNHGYGHFVFCYLDMGQAESVLAHELTHAYVAHLPLPTWLNEGVAQLCEINLTKRDSTLYDEIKETLSTHWKPTTIQDFWDGSGFLKDADSQMHCYHLAKVITARLLRQGPEFNAFLHDAHANDAGTAALRKYWNLTPADLVTAYLGEGAWHPVLPLHRAIRS